jgi:hypothetical protein
MSLRRCRASTTAKYHGFSGSTSSLEDARDVVLEGSGICIVSQARKGCCVNLLANHT